MAIDQIPEENLEQDLQKDLEPRIEEKSETVQEEQKVPYHQDPNVQLYIERQVAKKLGEGDKAWTERLDRLESNLSKKTKSDEPVTIGNWTPATPADAKAAKEIIAQAKREVLEEFSRIDEETREAQQVEDRAFADWLGELRVTSVLKDDNDEKEFARLILEYKLDDKEAAVNLWNRLQSSVNQAKEEGEEQGIKKAQEAKIGSARKGNEPGKTNRSFQQRKLEEPNFDAILEREMNRLGY